MIALDSVADHRVTVPAFEILVAVSADEALSARLALSTLTPYVLAPFHPINVG